jgi:hypothetical protein
MNMLGLSSSVHLTHIASYWKFLYFALHTSPLSVQALQSRSCLSYISHVLVIAELSYITTDGQSASLSWYQAPIWGLWPDFYYCQTAASTFSLYSLELDPLENIVLSYCCRGVLPLNCLAKSLGADDTENASFSVLLCCLSKGRYVTITSRTHIIHSFVAILKLTF